MNHHWKHTNNFKDGNTNPALDDYEYDANGNMVKDRNKGITSITYNYLNLPELIIFENSNSIEYTYNAAGVKLKKTVIEETATPEVRKEVDYLDGFQYNNSLLEFFPTAEGYVKVTAMSLNPDGPSYSYNYVYNYTDHLGNIRLSYTKDPQIGNLKILDESHYYPFGLKHQEYQANGFTTNPIQGVIIAPVANNPFKYKYNGKEFQDELELNMYAMDMRMYDPAIARWVVQDPIIHHNQSPYSSFDGNPVFWADPSGADAENNPSGGTGVSLVGGISLDSVMATSAVSFTSYADSYETIDTKRYTLSTSISVSEDNPEGATPSDRMKSYVIGEASRTISVTRTTQHRGGEDIMGLGISSLKETGKSMKNNAGKTTYGNNRFYFEKNNGYVFQGNQHTKVKSVAKFGSGIAKRAGIVGYAFSAGTIITNVSNEGGFGHESQKATAGVAGGMAGAWAGAEAGAFFGGVVGAWFGGVGAVPGAVIGGAIGGVIGGVLGSQSAESGFERYSQ